MKYEAGKYDVAVIGAGHAGCEAALASARMGMKTLLFSISLEAVANMPCNPHIGGSSKGHLVREIDALGGEMGKNIDKTYTQLKMLNKSKGPAVYSLRAQADRKRYQMEMKHTLEKQENLFLKQGEIVDIEVDDKKVKAVTTNIGARYEVDAVILATGTYLKGKIYIGENSFESGPDGVFPSIKLSDTLKNMGINLIRFKTGTPARINKKSIDFSKMEIQAGDKDIEPTTPTPSPETDDEFQKIAREHSEILDAAEAAGFPKNQATFDKLIALYADYGKETMLAGISACVDQGKTVISYLRACVKRIAEEKEKKPEPEKMDDGFWGWDQ